MPGNSNFKMIIFHVNVFFLVIIFQFTHAASDNALIKIKTNINHDKRDLYIRKPVKGGNFDFIYYNYKLGINKPAIIDFGKESDILNLWIKDLPLKLITHGWLATDNHDNGVFQIKKAYINSGLKFNVITMDWSANGVNEYEESAVDTDAVGSVLAQFLDQLVKHTGLKPADIHLIGHSLGAHVVGSAGAHLKSGKVGRITGLDPAGPSFDGDRTVVCMNFPKIQDQHLEKTDALFVDIIHTNTNTYGYRESIGHADFYPNSGVKQPGCFFRIGCSHSRAFELYADSIYHRKSLYGVKCDSWTHYTEKKCKGNGVSMMGHDADPSSRGNFYLKTNSKSPYSSTTK